MSPLLFYGLGILVLAGNIFAVWKGGPGEKLAGGMTLGVIILEQTLELIGHLPIAFAELDLILTVLVAFGYIVIAFKTASLFLGAAMLCQAAECATVGSVFIEEGQEHSNLSTWTNYETLVVTGFVVASVLWNLRRKPEPKPLMFYEVPPVSGVHPDGPDAFAMAALNDVAALSGDLRP